jgi:hypothetical protein
VGDGIKLCLDVSIDSVQDSKGIKESTEEINNTKICIKNDNLAWTLSVLTKIVRSFTEFYFAGIFRNRTLN